MRCSLSLALVLSLSLALAACGDDSGSSGNPFGQGGPATPYGIDPSDPDFGKKMVEGYMKAAEKIEINDESLGKLYAFAEQMKAAGDDPAKAAMLAREKGFGMIQYGKAMMKFEALRQALRRGPERLQKQVEDARKGLADLKQKLADAAPDKKAMLEKQLQVSEMMFSGYEKAVEEAKKLEDPGFRSTIEKWVKKFDALDDR